MPWYYRAEVKGIQRWIMMTSKLRDLKGGSMVIEQIPDAARALVAQGGTTFETLQCAAGAVSFKFDDRSALEAFAAEWPMRIAEIAPGLQVVHAWTDREDFDRVLASDLRARRNMPSIELPEAGPWLARSGRSGLPALAPDRAQSRAGWLHEDAALRRKATTLREANDRFREFGALAETGEGLIAFVHIDGTGIGRVFTRCPPGERSQLSRALSQAAEDALRQATNHFGLGTRLPLQVIVAGGDDVTFVCAADIALDLVERWLHAFEVNTSRLIGPPGLRAGAGIAIASRRYPFRRSYQLAEDLCKRAKKLAKTSDHQPIDSVLSLQRVTTSTSDLTVDTGVWRLDRDALANTPTPIPTLAQLRALKQAVLRQPRGGLRGWLTAFESAPRPADGTRRTVPETASRLWRRLEEVNRGFKAVETALSATGADPATGLGPALESDCYWSPIRDALTLVNVDRRKEP